MKKLLKKTLEPEKSFDQWAIDNDVRLPERHLRRNKKTFTRWTAVAAALIICFAVMLPFIINPEPKFYSEYEVDTEPIASVNNLKELEEFFKTNEILFFDFDRVLDLSDILGFNGISCDITKKNRTLILSYHIKGYLITFKNDTSDGFWVDYRILTYKNYKFMNSLNYSDLTPLFESNKSVVYYKIDDLTETTTAFVNFSYNKCDYFLKIEETDENTGKLTKESLQNFLADLFK